MRVDTEKLNQYNLLNKAAEQNGVVFWGADWMSDVPFAELARDNGIKTALHNRSLRGLTLRDADTMLDACICSLHPQKVFLNIGENELKDPEFDEKSFTDKYEWLLYSIHTRCRCTLYILSVVQDTTGCINRILQRLAEKYNCEYIDIRSCRSSYPKLFAKLRFFLRTYPMTFADIMNV
ncbi:MAG: hypothetical protein ACI4GO_06100 [Hominenteromicrobium sp.]